MGENWIADELRTLGVMRNVIEGRKKGKRRIRSSGMINELKSSACL